MLSTVSNLAMKNPRTTSPKIEGCGRGSIQIEVDQDAQNSDGVRMEEVKFAYKPSGQSGQSLSQFP